MASARIPVSWLLLLVAFAVFAFFGYQIFQAAYAQEEKFPPYSPADDAAFAAPVARTMMQDPSGGADVPADAADDGAAPIIDYAPPHAMPRVPGQTEDDLRAPEPLQATPPTTAYNRPEHRDPMAGPVHAEAEFGSNFRHPEQMIEVAPPRGTGNIVASGLGAEVSTPGAHNAAMYEPEMVTHGGEFMKGVFAWEGGNDAFSLI
jgi:hypothetical protein